MEEELTLEQVDALEDRFDIWSGDIALAFARHQARVEGGEIYTQVDGEDGRPMYLKGVHIVNRTGVYGVRIPKRGGEQCTQ